MKTYKPDKIHNVVLLSHYGAGKTSLTESMLYMSGAINRLGSVDEGTSTSDYDPSEIAHNMSINLSLVPVEWKETKINILDVPGYADFAGEVSSATKVSNAAIVIVDAVSGIQVGTEKLWNTTNELKIPKVVLINKLDRENADFSQVVKSLQEKFGANCLPVHLPIGSGESFSGLVDLITMRGYEGKEGKEIDIPEAIIEHASTQKEKVIEAAVEVDDMLLTKYLDGETLSGSEVLTALRKAISLGSVIPVFVSSALKIIGVGQLMDSIINFLPSASDTDSKVLNDQGITVPADDGTDTGTPLVAFVFKTTADQFTGKVSYLRIYSGCLKSNSQVWNANKKSAERIGQLFMLTGKNQTAVEQLTSGDIGAVAKLNTTLTGDTLCFQDHPVTLGEVEYPEVSFSMAVQSETKGDVDKIGTVLPKITEEDPSVKVFRDAATRETILSGIGDTHLEIIKERMQRKFGVKVKLQTPKIAYKETISSSTKAEYKHKKQSGGHGQYGHVLLELEPTSRGEGFEFVDKIVGGAIPRNYIPVVEKGVIEAKGEGILAGYPVDDVRVTLYDGSFHPVDSSDIAFKIAAAQALKKGLTSGNPVLLEPIMIMKIVVPSSNTGDILGDLNTKRGQVLGMEPYGDNTIIQAKAPFSEVIRYAIDLKSMTQGRGSFSLEFSHYEIVPAHLTQKIIAEKTKE